MNPDKEININYIMPRCPNGTRRNKKTGQCEAKKTRTLRNKTTSSKKTTSSSITLEDLKNDPYEPKLTKSDILEIVSRPQNLDNKKGVSAKLDSLKINYDFDGTYASAIKKNRFGIIEGKTNRADLAKLISRYDTIPKIKDHLLWRQASSLVMLISKDYLAIKDIK